MARGTVVGSAVIVREKYFWPDAQLNFWTIVMLATAGTILGVFAEFLVIQNRMRQEIPWYLGPIFSRSKAWLIICGAGSFPMASLSAV